MLGDEMGVLGTRAARKIGYPAWSLMASPTHHLPVPPLIISLALSHIYGNVLYTQHPFLRTMLICSLFADAPERPHREGRDPVPSRCGWLAGRVKSAGHRHPH